MKNRPFRQRLGFAVAGIVAGWRRERSFRSHVAMAGLAVVALLVLRPAPLWWALMMVTIAAVMTLELVNSAIEAVIDLLHPEIHPEIGVAKDMAAGAVLIASIAAVAVGVAMLVAHHARLLEMIGASE